MTYTERALQLRPIMEQAAQSLDDNTALAAVELFPQWEKLVADGKTVGKGFRFQHGTQLYRTEQPTYTFVSHYVPGSTGTESLFSKVDETHAGTREDPIPYDGNMILEDGKYYSQGGVVYICTSSTGNPVYHALSDLVGLYVEVAV